MGRKSIEKERKTLNAKQKIWLGNTLPFFYKEGISGSTMNDIAKHLNLSKATIYNYYQSKEDLVHDSLWVKLKELEQLKNHLFDEDKDFIERYFEGVRLSADCLAGMTDIYLTDLKENYPKSWNSIVYFKEKSIENLTKYYQMGIERGIFRPFDVKIMAACDLVIFNSFINPNFLTDNGITVQDAFSEYFNMKFNGILEERNLSIISNYQKN